MRKKIGNLYVLLGVLYWNLYNMRTLYFVLLAEPTNNKKTDTCKISRNRIGNLNVLSGILYWNLYIMRAESRNNGKLKLVNFQGHRKFKYTEIHILWELFLIYFSWSPNK